MTTSTSQSELVTVTIDGVDVQVPKGTLLVEAAKQIQRDIPVYCYHTKLGPAGLCRICLVEIEGMPKLQIACNTPVADKMVVHTESDKSNEGRRAVLELLLLNHPLDCPICDKGGECDLQDFSMAYGQGASRLADVKSSKPKAVDLGPTIVLDEERCILCLRCVRFDDIITHERSLRTEDRGAHAIIATATGQPYVSDFSGNVTELCPVGALTSKTYRFRSRPWDNHRTTTTCTQCSVGCQMHVDQRLDTIQRTMSVAEDDAISDGWLCDRGRYNLGYLTDARRLTQPLLKANGEWIQIGWDDAIAQWAGAIKAALAAGGPATVGAIGGGRLLNEEAFLLAHVHRALGIENLDWRTGRQQRVWPGPGGMPSDLEQADVIITFGRPPAQLAPILDLRIRKAVMGRGALLIAVGDHAASLAVPAERVGSVKEAAARLPASASTIAFVFDGTVSAEQPAVEALAKVLTNAGKTLHVFVPGEQANARGAEVLGMLPGADGLDTRAMLEAGRDGKLAVLSLLGANPALHWPDGQLAREALSATPFVVVSDLFMTETAELATLVLPACSAFEKSGTTTNLSGLVLPVVAGVPAPDSTLADGDMLVALAEALEVDLPLPDQIEAAIAAAVRGEPPATGLALPEAGSRAMVGVDVVRVVIESAPFTGGGTLAHDERLAELRATPRARMHPQTASRLGVVAGQPISLAAPGGAQLDGLIVVLDESVGADAVALLDGLPAAPANRLRNAPNVALVRAPAAV